MLDREGFRPNVGVILLNARNQVFWGKRLRTHSWQFPQGGIKHGETPEQAMFRELHEEVGLGPQDVEMVAGTRHWLRYRLPRRFVRHRSRPLCIGQKQRWFLLRMVADEERVRFDVTAKPEFDGWRWVDYWTPVREVIYFKRLVYARALLELAGTAFPGGPPPHPEWWSDELFRGPAVSRGRRAAARGDHVAAEPEGAADQ